MKICETCRYRQELECRRNPPLNGYPTVKPENWCGEYMPKPTQPKEQKDANP